MTVTARSQAMAERGSGGRVCVCSVDAAGLDVLFMRR